MSEHTERFRLEAEHIYVEWDKMLSSNNVDGLLALYTHDATIESPVISYLLGKALKKHFHNRFKHFPFSIGKLIDHIKMVSIRHFNQ